MRAATNAPSRHPDAGELAAFIDGKLSRAERSRVIEHITACADCYEVFSEAVHVLDDEAAPEETEVSPTAKVILHPRARWARWGVPAAILAAAAALAVAVGPRLLDWFSGEAPAARDLVAGLDATAPVGEHLGDDLGWPVYRGTGPDEPLERTDETSASFRLGVRQVDLQAALRLGDGPQAAGFAADMVRDLDSHIELSQGEVETYHGLGARLEKGESPAALASSAHQADLDLEHFLAPPVDRWYALGRWAEAGRLAAAAGDSRLFRQRTFRRFAGRLDPGTWPPSVAAQLRPVRDRLRTGVTGQAGPELAKALATLVRVGGGGSADAPAADREPDSSSD